jgi:hypothetical protein
MVDKVNDNPKKNEQENEELVTIGKKDLMYKEATLKTQNEKLNKFERNYQAKVDRIKELEAQLNQNKVEEENKLKEAGELKPLLEAKEAELLKLKEENETLKQNLADNTKSFQEKELKYRIKSKLGDKIKKDWTKEEDPIEEALKLYPLSEITIDDNNQPTNEEEITKQFFEKYPGIMVSESQNGNDATTQGLTNHIIAAGGTKNTTIPTGINPHIKKIAEKEHLDVDTVKRRLEDPRWQQNWAHYVEETKRVFPDT